MLGKDLPIPIISLATGNQTHLVHDNVKGPCRTEVLRAIPSNLCAQRFAIGYSDDLDGCRRKLTVSAQVDLPEWGLTGWWIDIWMGVIFHFGHTVQHTGHPRGTLYCTLLMHDDQWRNWTQDTLPSIALCVCMCGHCRQEWLYDGWLCELIYRPGWGPTVGDDKPDPTMHNEES